MPYQTVDIDVSERSVDPDAPDRGVRLFIKSGSLHLIDDTGSTASLADVSLDTATADHLDFTPQDVRNLSPVQGTVAYHDGSGSNTEGLANYDGSAWTSLVDGTTVS